MLTSLKLCVRNFHNVCTEFISNIDFIKNNSPQFYDNILTTLLDEYNFLSNGDIDKYETISEFMQYHRNINIIANKLVIFVNLVNFNIDRRYNLTDTAMHTYDIHRSKIVVSSNAFKRLFNAEYDKSVESFINNINYETIDDNQIHEINNIFNNSFFINTKANLIYSLPKMTIKVASAEECGKYNLNDHNIKNLVVVEYTELFNKFIDTSNLIVRLHELNKSNVLNLSNITFVDKYKHPKLTNIFTLTQLNSIQLFSLIPFQLNKGTHTLTIDEIIHKICGIELKKTDSLFNDLLNVCNVYTPMININFVIVIINHSGNMVNYNINQLFNTNIRTGSKEGLTDDIIYKFNTISFGKATKIDHKQVTVVNYSNDNDNIALILDTNDGINFRVLINKPIISKTNKQLEDGINNSIFIDDYLLSKLLLHRKINNRIESYNSAVEESILSKIKSENKSFYYSSIDTNYDIYTDDRIYIAFTNYIIDAMATHIDYLIKRNPTSSEISLLIDDSNIDLFRESILKYYPKLNLNDKESFLTYLSNLENTVSKFRKELIDSYNRLPDGYIPNKINTLMHNAITTVINSKSNIYDSAIAKEQIIIAFKNKIHDY